jgi:DNA primase
MTGWRLFLTLAGMSQPIISLRDRAEFYHRQLPQAMRRYLNSRGIPDTLIERYTLGWDGKAITIPIEDRNGKVVFLKLAKSPFDGTRAPKLQTPPGASVELFPWKTIQRQPGRIVIAENELDCLVLEARGFPAVCSTAGARSFKAEWAEHFEGIDHVYVCFDRDASGARAAEKVATVIPGATIVRLPEAVGPGGGVTDFFVRLGNTRWDFELGLAKTISSVAAETPPPITRSLKRAERLNADVPIARVISGYTTLRRESDQLIGRCPLHGEDTVSLHVYPKTNTFHCFGCGAGGDVITFVEKAENLTFGQALEALENIRYADDRPNLAA